ncbi:MAG TPA: hypothetical protein VML19_30850 [Verrucomicrobiae bacterium]|nr:hypothetical protein [Verrucomicrobiae bacterium]
MLSVNPAVANPREIRVSNRWAAHALSFLMVYLILMAGLLGYRVLQLAR